MTAHETNQDRIGAEFDTISYMIHVYCRRKHGSAEPLCEDCKALLQYARGRLLHCRFSENKPVCSRCPVHCYRPDMREKNQNVMRFVGPRMLFYSPRRAIRHLRHKWRSRDPSVPDSTHTERDNTSLPDAGTAAPEEHK